ncbi:hypothetical protein Pcinc_011268 [Petrolisthes cinctipes]|uniref:Uncharacterized protein n=1 Tax=Petrolisthes cinctipes TaxID=88211 RepID=A0AAE1G3E5_PETCI|nr:hypothetical protein Pcinc_011268 [Petrolisthes cinctipes]
MKDFVKVCVRLCFLLCQVQGALEILRDGVKVSCLDLSDQSVQYEEVCLYPSILDLENLTCRMAGEIVYQCQDNLNCKDDGALKDKTIPRENTDCQGIPLRSLNNVLGDYTCTSPHGSLAFTPPLCSETSKWTVGLIVVLVVVPCVMLVACVMLVVWYFCCRRRQSDQLPTNRCSQEDSNYLELQPMDANTNYDLQPNQEDSIDAAMEEWGQEGSIGV